MRSQSSPSNLSFCLVDTPEYQLVEIELAGLIDTEDLASHDLATRLNPSRPVVFYGLGPTWLYAHLTALGSNMPWVACGDARFGAVVVHRTAPDAPAIGTKISRREFARFLQRRRRPPGRELRPSRRSQRKAIAIVGPPHSGKTVFSLGVLWRSLQARVGRDFWREIFFISSAPDGEGKWSQQVPQRLAKILRRKGAWSETFAKRAAQAIRGVKSGKRLVFVDCGGVIDSLQRAILNECSHGIIVSKKREAISEWRGALSAFDINVLGEIETTSKPSTQRVLNHDPLRLKMGYLARNQPKKWPELPDVLLDLILQDSGLG